MCLSCVEKPGSRPRESTYFATSHVLRTWSIRQDLLMSIGRPSAAEKATALPERYLVGCRLQAAV